MFRSRCYSIKGMLSLLVVVGLFFPSFQSRSQNIGINTTGAAPDASAMLDIVSSSKGLLIPRITLSATNVIAPVTGAATSMLVYNTATAGTGDLAVYPGFYYWGGSEWLRLFNAGDITNDWSIDGNAGTDPTLNYIGTSDNVDLVFRTFGTEKMRINTSGNIDIGGTLDDARIYAEVGSSDLTTNHGAFIYHDGGITAGATYGIRSINASVTDDVKYGIHSYLNSNGEGGRFGFYNYVEQNSSSTSTPYGIYNNVTANGDAANNYGIYNHLNGTTTAGSHYGQRNFVYVDPNNANPDYGEYTFVDFSTGNSYGEYKILSSNTAYDGDLYGDYNRLTGNGDGLNHGTYNLMQASGNGIQYAIYNDIEATGTGVKYGMRNEFSNVGGTKYGVYNFFPNGSATGNIYGVYNQILNDGNATKVGSYTYISGGEGSLRGSYNYIVPSSSNSSAIYGVYSYVDPAGSGGIHYGGYFSAMGDNHYAVYGTNNSTNGWAGYLDGNFYADGNSIINESGTADHDLRVESDNRTNALWVDSDENLVRFGTANVLSDQGNGSIVSGTTIDYVADFDNGSSAGTAIGIGSVEYMVDLPSETAISNRFSPSVDNTYDLGSAALRWNEVYATNGTIVTSDVREKTEIKELEYGLAEIMKLKPVTYKWKKDFVGSTRIPENEKEIKLGLIAQDVQLVLPEVVQTHDWQVVSEEQPDAYVLTEMERLGMNYHEIVPVLIKAIQEQQEKILELENRINELKK